MTIRDIAVALGFEVDKKSEQRTEQAVTDLKDFATKALATIGVGFSLSMLNGIAEEFSAINNNIRSATEALGKQEEIQEHILAAANNARMSYQYTANFATKLVRENKSLFGNVNEAAKFAELTAKLFKTAGKSQEEIASLQESINVSFAQGIVDTETINRLLEDAPEAANLLAESIGTSSDKLMELASNGQISLEQLKGAFIDNEETINKGFENVALTISDAKLQIRNQFGEILDDFNQALGLTETIATLMTKGFNFLLAGMRKTNSFLQMLSSRLGGANNLLKLIAASIGAIIIAANGTKILGFLSSVCGGLKAINLQTLGIAAVALTLFLLIDDLVNFMNGNKSVISTVFESMGISGDEAREMIGSLWETSKEFLAGFKQLLPPLIDLGENLLSILIDLGKKVLPIIIDAFKDILSPLEKLINAIIPALTKLLEFLAPIIAAVAAIVADVLGYAFEFVGRIIEKVLVPIFEGVAKFLEGDWLGTIGSVADGFCNAFSSALGVIDGLFGTSLQKWYDEVRQFWTNVGGYLYEATHQGEIEMNELHSKYNTLNADLNARVVELLKDGLSAEDALEQAKGELLDTSEKLYYYNNAFGDTEYLKNASQWRENLINSGQLVVSGGGGRSRDNNEIPALANGGIVTSPTTALIGEGGEPEAVIPLSKLKSLLEKANMFSVSQKSNDIRAASNISNTKTVTQNVTINNSFSGGVAAAQTEGAKTMNTSAKDATAILARGLAYTR